MTILTFLLKHCMAQMREHYFLQIVCTDLNCPGSNKCKFIDFHRTSPIHVKALSSCTNLKHTRGTTFKSVEYLLCASCVYCSASTL